MLEDLLVHHVTIRKMVPPGGPDAYGNAALIHDPDQDVTVAARVQHSTGIETTTDRDFRREDFRVFLAAGATVTALDRLYWIDADRELAINGPVAPEYGGLLAVHHLELSAYDVEL